MYSVHGECEKIPGKACPASEVIGWIHSIDIGYLRSVLAFLMQSFGHTFGVHKLYRVDWVWDMMPDAGNGPPVGFYVESSK